MKKLINKQLLLLAVLFMAFSCSVTDQEDPKSIEAIPLEIQAKIQDMGFDVNDIIRYNNGYLVEGDIYLNDEIIAESLENASLPDQEQYRTSNLVTVSGSQRTIRVYLEPSLRSAVSGRYLTALRRARDRYNAVSGLRLRFVITTNSSSANIRIVGFSQGPDSQGRITLGSAGFPRFGNPFNQIRMNRFYYDTRGTLDQLATTMAHEIGHCIGFRHTDYFNRSISCGSGGNEGSGGVGAIRIPGTPSGADLAGNGSFMLACSGGNRPFTANDVTALKYLY